MVSISQAAWDGLVSENVTLKARLAEREVELDQQTRDCIAAIREAQDRGARLAEEKEAQERFAIRAIGQEAYDNSPCQAHPLELVEARLAEAEAAAKTWENEAERRSRRYEMAAVRLAEVIEFGGQCATGITGDPEDAANVRDVSTALLAIREGVRLGYEAHNERITLKARLAEARDARDLAEGKLIAYERMAERIHTYCRELSDGENVRLTDYEPWEAWLELDGALAELGAAIAVQPDAAPSVADLYNELLYAVEKKYPGESRHDTALRHIRDRETISKGESQRAADNGSEAP